MNIIKLVVAFFLSFTQFFSPFFSMVFYGGTDSYYDEWSVNTNYTEDYAVTLEKDPNKDFVVLNFADVQLSSDEVYGEEGRIAEANIERCINEVQPDLITLTGDNAWCKMGYIRLVEVIDSYGIPWAPVMGNHDGDNGDWTSENWCALQMYNAENCLFKFGPKNMGVGNYIINITQNGEVIHSLYMMDTHTNTDLECGGYDHLWDNQIKWYAWGVNGNNELAGKNVESSIFFHIPCVQFAIAYDEANYNPETGKFTNPAYAGAYGRNDEPASPPEYDSGFFDVVKELGSTKNIIVGHDHINDSSIVYEGVTLSYALKCGPGCYWNPDQNGGSTLTIDANGHGHFAHHYVDPATL